MKTLKFRESLIPLVLSGEKYVTWRFFDDKDIQEGELVQFVNWNTRAAFAQAKITKIEEKDFASLTEADMEGHEKFKNLEEMKRTYQEYYPLDNLDTEKVKIIYFQLQ